MDVSKDRKLGSLSEHLFAAYLHKTYCLTTFAKSASVEHACVR